jgi:hypothetical protein
MAIELTTRNGVDKNHFIKFHQLPIYGIEIAWISLLVSIHSWKWMNIESTIQFIIYFGNYRSRGAPRMHCNTKDGVNCRDWTRFPDPLWRHSYVQVGRPSNPELYGNARMPSGHSWRTTELGRVECLCGVMPPRVATLEGYAGRNLVCRFNSHRLRYLYTKHEHSRLSFGSRPLVGTIDIWSGRNYVFNY